MTKLKPSFIIFCAYSAVPLCKPANKFLFFAASKIFKISLYALEFSALSKPGSSPTARLRSAGPMYMPSKLGVSKISSSFSKAS